MMDYPDPPFNPPQIFPEYTFSKEDLDPQNFVYEGVRELFHILELDIKNYGKANWNPLKGIIHPNQTVLIKPNFVISKHRKMGNKKIAIFSAITHGSVLRAIVDYAFLSVGKNGRIIIGDAPMLWEDFDKIMELNGINAMIQYLRDFGVPIETVDFRDHLLTFEGDLVKQKGDPSGYTVIDLKNSSEFRNVSEYYQNYRFPFYKSNEQVILHHNRRKNEYSIANTVLNSDCVISVAKLKTHRKAGVTLSLKNFVGITNMREWLPHHRLGAPPQGDECPVKCNKRSLVDITLDRLYSSKLLSRTSKIIFGERYLEIWSSLVNLLKKDDESSIEDGSWYLNDTTWRMVLDLNKILFYAGSDKKMHRTQQRKYMSIIDGIIAGEGEGPLESEPKKSGVLIGGFDPVATDTIAAKVIGVNPALIPTIKNTSSIKDYPLGTNSLSKIKVLSNISQLPNLYLRLPSGWKNVKIKN